MISVGNVRMIISRMRRNHTTPLLLLMLVEASTATGSASVAPIMEPMMDILMVSSSAPISFEVLAASSGFHKPRK